MRTIKITSGGRSAIRFVIPDAQFDKAFRLLGVAYDEWLDLPDPLEFAEFVELIFVENGIAFREKGRV